MKNAVLEKNEQKKNVTADQSIKTRSNKISNISISKFMYLHNLECDLYDEILELDITDSKKDSICDKLNELLNNLMEA